ncbi:hypothetical protein GCM10022379_13330 [Micromonospora maritima]
MRFALARTWLERQPFKVADRSSHELGGALAQPFGLSASSIGDEDAAPGCADDDAAVAKQGNGAGKPEGTTEALVPALQPRINRQVP